MGLKALIGRLQITRRCSVACEASAGQRDDVHFSQFVIQLVASVGVSMAIRGSSNCDRPQCIQT